MLRFIIIFFLCFTCLSFSNTNEKNHIATLQKQVEHLEARQKVLESEMEKDDFLRQEKERNHAKKFTTKLNQPGLILLLSAAFCSLWAQYTQRSSILWFALGFFLAPITIIVLLYKSSNDLNNGKMKPWDQ